MSEEGTDKSLYLKRVGAVSRKGTPGPVDSSITINPLLQCPERIPLDGPDGLLNKLSGERRTELVLASSKDDVGYCSSEFWAEFNNVVNTSYKGTKELLNWLMTVANPHVFNDRNPAEASWREEQDTALTASRLFGIASYTFAAWRPPASPDDPYLAGLVPMPYEQSMIENDARIPEPSAEALFDWQPQGNARYDIHVVATEDGRRLEVMNVNATPIESRTGTDLIYYYEPAHSFILVQYKRLPSKKEPLRIDKRFYEQLDRLENVASHSKNPSKPSDWRLGSDSCFMKLAYWDENKSGQVPGELCDGMYLPVSYIRMLLADDCTRGPQRDSNSRLIGYGNTERHLVGSQFIHLVAHGLVGTTGVSVEELRSIVDARIQEGQNVMVGFESGPEDGKKRQARLRKRTSDGPRYRHQRAGQLKVKSAVTTRQPRVNSTAFDTPTLF